MNNYFFENMLTLVALRRRQPSFFEDFVNHYGEFYKLHHQVMESMDCSTSTAIAHSAAAIADAGEQLAMEYYRKS